MQKTLWQAANEHLDLFTNAAGDKVLFGLPADSEPVQLSGIAIWRVREGRLAECWVKRNAFELFETLRRP